MTKTGQLEGRIALITGASRGLGAAVATRFAAEGAHVVLVARSIGDLEAVDDAIQTIGGQATLVPMDLRQAEKIDQLVPLLVERFGRLDCFVGNAGLIGSLRPIAQTPDKEWNDVLAVNLTANHRFIRALDPLLRASKAGRAIFVTSGVADGIHPYWSSYAISKAALNYMVQLYAREVEGTALKVNLVDPGALKTDMRAQAYPGENPESLPDPEAATDLFVSLAALETEDHGVVHHLAA